MSTVPMRMKKPGRSKLKRPTLGDWIIWMIMILVWVIVLYPVLLVVAGSFSNADLLLRGEVGIIPRGFTIRNYVSLFQNETLWTAYGYSIYYTVLAVFFNVILTCMTAYPLSKRSFVGRRKWNFILMFTMLFGGGLIPSFILNARILGWMNTPWAFTLSGCVGAWNVILARTFFESIPDSLDESAKLDGATDLQILFKIYLPLSMPIVATLGLYAAVGAWNNYMGPLIYMHDAEKQPLALLLRQWLTVDGGSSTTATLSDELAIPQLARNYTAIIVTMLPIIAIYPFIQRYFVKGMMVGAIKG